MERLLLFVHNALYLVVVSPCHNRLADLYNLKCLKTEYSVRCQVLCSLIGYAAKTSNLDYLSNFLANVCRILGNCFGTVKLTNEQHTKISNQSCA